MVREERFTHRVLSESWADCFRSKWRNLLPCLEHLWWITEVMDWWIYIMNMSNRDGWVVMASSWQRIKHVSSSHPKTEWWVVSLMHVGELYCIICGRLAPSDFIFPKMQIRLKGWRFDTTEEIQVELQKVLCFGLGQKCWGHSFCSLGISFKGNGGNYYYFFFYRYVFGSFWGAPNIWPTYHFNIGVKYIPD